MMRNVVNDTIAALLALAVAGCAGTREHAQCPALHQPARDFGAISGSDSALLPSEVRVDGAWAKNSVQSAPTNDVLTGSVIVRYTRDFVTGRLGYTGAVHSLEQRPDDTFTRGNLRAGLGFHTASLGLNGVYRRGVAFRVDLSVDIDAKLKATQTDLLLVPHRPFDLLDLAPGQYVSNMVELRYELVGCNAPFVHAQLGFRVRKDIAMDTFAVPGSIAFGSHVSRRTMVFGEYAALVGRFPTPDDDVHTLSRFRGGVEFQGRARVALMLDVMVGAVDGMTFGISIAAPWFKEHR